MLVQHLTRPALLVTVGSSQTPMASRPWSRSTRVVRPERGDQVEHGGVRGQAARSAARSSSTGSVRSALAAPPGPEPLVAGEPEALGEQLVGPAGLQAADPEQQHDRRRRRHGVGERPARLDAPTGAAGEQVLAVRGRWLAPARGPGRRGAGAAPRLRAGWVSSSMQRGGRDAPADERRRSGWSSPAVLARGRALRSGSSAGHGRAGRLDGQSDDAAEAARRVHAAPHVRRTAAARHPEPPTAARGCRGAARTPHRAGGVVAQPRPCRSGWSLMRPNAGGISSSRV